MGPREAAGSEMRGTAASVAVMCECVGVGGTHNSTSRASASLSAWKVVKPRRGPLPSKGGVRYTFRTVIATRPLGVARRNRHRPQIPFGLPRPTEDYLSVGFVVRRRIGSFMRTLSVHQLREGDKFEFLLEGRTSPLDEKFGLRRGAMVVVRAPRVNPAANSCFFRYRPLDDDSPEAHSWNGMADVQVAVLGAPDATGPANSSPAAPSPTKPAAEVAAAEPQAKAARPVKTRRTKDAAPAVEAEPAAKKPRKSAAAAKSPAEPAADKKAAGRTTVRRTDTSPAKPGAKSKSVKKARKKPAAVGKKAPTLKSSAKKPGARRGA